MHIKLVEIQNFRKLKSVRVEFAEEKTVFVGANNSGKTSAMVALRCFLVERKFSVNDFTLCNWPAIEGIAKKWEAEQLMDGSTYQPSVEEWADVLPAMDVWLSVNNSELHHVIHLLPTLDWNGGDLGVRLRFEPENIADLYKEYLIARGACREVMNAATKGADGRKYDVPLWPATIRSFLEKNLSSQFIIRAYVLDPVKLVAPQGIEAMPQKLAADSECLASHPFTGLIRIDEINAQRDFDEANGREGRNSLDDDTSDQKTKRPLSTQLRSYYTKHTDPSDFPDASDIEALEAIHKAQGAFDSRIRAGLSDALLEVENLNYPGITDPKITLSSKIKPMDGLNHPSALQYEVPSFSGGAIPLLPENYNGLGYQNLLSMVFRLLSFRDAWMRVGKVGKRAALKQDDGPPQEPLHLVLVEEPEAHLHVQVQQIFIRKAYEILRKHANLGSSKILTTQLVVSTHSSHVAHECDYSSLRYFRRIPASKAGDVPITTVVNLSTVFGAEDDTKRFVTRYLRATHCDLFFADAVILVEGSCERIMVPHFIKNHFKHLDHCYTTILEINGRHAYRLRPLIEHIGLIALIITDLDSADSGGYHESRPPARGANLISGNTTLSSWVPLKKDLDALLDATAEEKVKAGDSYYSVRVAYQSPVMVAFDKQSAPVEALSSTFEDAIIFSNLEFFEKARPESPGETFSTFAKLVAKNRSPASLSSAILKALTPSARKAEFALDLLFAEDFKDLKVPPYIREGLEWLELQLTHKKKEIIAKEAVQAIAGGVV